MLHLPQFHQLGLGLGRSRIHLRPGQQTIPGGVAQLLLQLRLVALPQRQQQILQPHRHNVGACAGEPQQACDPILQSLQHPSQIAAEQYVQPLHHGSLHRGAPGSVWIELQRLIAIGQQLLHIPQRQRLQHQGIAEHRSDLGVALHHCAHGIGGTHHDQMQAVVQQRLIADTPEQIRRSRRVRLTEIFEVVEVQHDAAGALADRVTEQVAQHPRPIQQQRPWRRGHALALAAAKPKPKGRQRQSAPTQADTAYQLLGGLHLGSRCRWAVGQHGVIDAGEQLAQQVFAGVFSTDRDDLVTAPVAPCLGIGLYRLHKRGLADARATRYRLPRAGAAADSGQEQLSLRLPAHKQTQRRGLRIRPQGCLEVGRGAQVVEAPQVRQCHGGKYWQRAAASQYWSCIGRIGNTKP